MTRNIPVIPTIFVLVCMGIMIALGFWQLGRADQKEALLIRYQSISADEPAVPYPQMIAAMEAMLYRHNCY